MLGGAGCSDLDLGQVGGQVVGEPSVAGSEGLGPGGLGVPHVFSGRCRLGGASWSEERGSDEISIAASAVIRTEGLAHHFSASPATSPRVYGPPC